MQNQTQRNKSFLTSPRVYLLTTTTNKRNKPVLTQDSNILIAVLNSKQNNPTKGKRIYYDEFKISLRIICGHLRHLLGTLRFVSLCLLWWNERVQVPASSFPPIRFDIPSVCLLSSSRTRHGLCGVIACMCLRLPLRSSTESDWEVLLPACRPDRRSVTSARDVRTGTCLPHPEDTDCT